MPGRPAKRIKVDDGTVSVANHPLNVRPLGNAFVAEYNLKHTASAGLLGWLPDELLMQILGSLGPEDLCSISATSRCMYAYSHSEELWRPLFTSSKRSSDNFIWRGTWRKTYLGLPKEVPIIVENLFSDVLYRPVFCAVHPIAPFAQGIPKRNQILKFSNLTKEEFTNYKNTPFILTEPVKKWPAYMDWSIKKLAREHAQIKFRAESVDWKLETYYDYMRDCVYDESPLYLFDKYFVEKTVLGDKYTVPEIFQEDYFEVLREARPDRRWLIIGPTRSGSTFHKDPNATSAWNAVLEGEKYWIMFPPTVVAPPGVFVSDDQSEVTSPLSIMEWLLNFHKEARASSGCVEGVCKAGEVLYVPSGWWHLVVNLSDAMAITQNFVSRAHLAKTLLFLRDEPQNISGFAKSVQEPYTLFRDRLEDTHPEVFSEVLKEMEEKSRAKSGRWENLVSEAKQTGGFSFQFGAPDSESESESEQNC